MPRFTDEWIVDKVLFDYVNGGTCSCCSFTMFLPGGTAELIGAVTDLDTDQANTEVAALHSNPWPSDLRDHVWASRVRLRQKLKGDMKTYNSFWKEYEEPFQSWCRENYKLLSRLMQLPKSEIIEVLEQKYGVHSAFSAVMKAVLDQVSHFHLTEYPTDARGDTEINFEHALGFSRMGGFTIEIATDGVLNDEILEIWFNRMKTLGGPKLLDRGAKTTTTISSNDEEDDGSKGGDIDGPVSNPSAKPSFQPDRRILRLIIARYWADLLMKRFLDDHDKNSTG